MEQDQDIQELTTDFISVFQLETNQASDKAVRGRAVRLGAVLDKALGHDRYPPRVAALLGEAMMIAALVARALKFKGRLVVQCHGTNEGAVSLLMADCTTDGSVRGYARWDSAALREIELDSRNPGAKALLGGGTFSMTIDQGPDMDNYQGLAAIEGESLAACAEHYFKQSEQIPTEIKLACGQVQTPGQDPSWRGGGMLIQRIAPDVTRGQTDDDWDTARALFATLSDEELIDPDLPQDELLFRLFNETGVRIIERAAINADCQCSEDRLEATLKTFDAKALDDIAEDGKITANCEFCGTDYVFDVSTLLAAGGAS
ncbi:Hsp33 family molecular chaperone HslO [Fretibacter rubidus]|uniref:Hsp33 family molecular chaperone HslO n=1 Tax=Fretibacter rubidus TaxID=570162 RepID=UPI00352BCC99